MQESLGGNYKTSLIVASSPHSSQFEETVSTLKFATRAKTIKTNAKMNLKTGESGAKIMVARMRMELLDAKGELDKYRNIVNLIRGEITRGAADEDDFYDDDAPNKLQNLS